MKRIMKMTARIKNTAATKSKMNSIVEKGPTSVSFFALDLLSELDDPIGWLPEEEEPAFDDDGEDEEEDGEEDEEEEGEGEGGEEEEEEDSLTSPPP